MSRFGISEICFQHFIQQSIPHYQCYLNVRYGVIHNSYTLARAYLNTDQELRCFKAVQFQRSYSGVLD